MEIRVLCTKYAPKFKGSNLSSVMVFKIRKSIYGMLVKTIVTRKMTGPDHSAFAGLRFLVKITLSHTLTSETFRYFLRCPIKSFLQYTYRNE